MLPHPLPSLVLVIAVTTAINIWGGGGEVDKVITDKGSPTYKICYPNHHPHLYWSLSSAKPWLRNYQM